MPQPKTGNGKKQLSKTKQPVSKPRRKYSGELAEPLEPVKIGLITDEKQKNSLLAERDLLEANKLLLLLEEYRVQPGDRQWLSLALALAREYVPGFQEKVNKGAPLKWTRLRLWLLAGEIHRQMDLGASSAAEASRRLAAKEPWVSFLGKWREGKAVEAKPADALLEQYRKMPESDRKAGEHAFRWNKHAETLDKWDEMIKDAIEGQPEK